MPKRAIYDKWLLYLPTALALFGMIMVGSAASYLGLKSDLAMSYYGKHLLNLAVGFGALYLAFRFPYRWLSNPRLITCLVLGCTMALVVVLMMPAAGGAHRWFPIGPFKIQPSEFAKLIAILFMAVVLSRQSGRINDPRGVLVPALAIVGSMACLVLVEPDLGSAAMLVAVVCVMLFVAGLNWRWIGVTALLGLTAFGVGVLAKDYRWERIKTFLHGGADDGAGYQVTQSLIAVGSGGLTGAGLGQGQQKAFFVPAVHTDFIFSVIGEEFGLIGTLLLLSAFLVLFWRGMRTAWRARDPFGFYLALGLTSLLVFQALINMGVCLGLLPTKGLPLPFISYGGSSLLASMTAVGLLLNVSQHSR